MLKIQKRQEDSEKDLEKVKFLFTNISLEWSNMKLMLPKAEMISQTKLSGLNFSFCFLFYFKKTLTGQLILISQLVPQLHT